MNFFERHPSATRILLYGGAAVFSGFAFAWVFTSGLVNLLVDAKSHLLQTLQVVHSITPGVSQIGFWPPLLRVLLVPVAILLPKPLTLDIGAFLTLQPLLLLGSYFMYGIARHSGASSRMALLAPAMFVLNPYVQYYASSSMTEVPCIVMVFGATFYALRWTDTKKLTDLFLFALFVSFATLARYEGFALIPLSITYVLYACWKSKMPFQQLKAVSLLFVFIALLGLFTIVLYSTVYAGSPLSFLSLGVERVGGTAPSFVRKSPGMAAVYESTRMFLYASSYMQGGWNVAAFLACIPIALFLRRRMQDAFVLAFLASPGLFVLLMMIVRRNNIAVPELPRLLTYGAPAGIFVNTRYALTWIGCGIIAVVCTLGVMSSVRYLRGLTRYVLAPLALLGSCAWFAQVFFIDHFRTIRMDESASVVVESSFLGTYDGGRILMPRYFGEGTMLYANVPMDMFVYEGSYLYFDQAVHEPWLFVKWVVIRTRVNSNIRFIRDMLAMEGTTEFQHYYELVESGDSGRIYRLRENVIRKSALSLGYDTARIPSLNPLARWNPRTVYEDITN